MSRMETTNDAKKRLPDGWRWVKLREVADHIDYGYTASADVEIKTPRFLRITDIQDGRVNWESVPGCAISDADEDAKRLEGGDIVFARTGATTGKSYLISNPPRSVFASYLIRVKSHREHVEPDYLFAFFQSDGYWEQISAGARGGAQPGFNATMLKSLRIPLPPVEEQRRIARVLREQMAAVEKARAAAQARLEAVKTLPASLLRQIFPQPGQPLPAGWRWVRLGEVCEINPRRNDIIRPDIEPTSFVPMEAVDAEKGMICEVRERPFADVKKGYTYFEEGDVLFAKITPCMQNGKHAIARNLIEGIGFASTEFHVIRPAKGILAEWIHHFVRQPAVLHDATNHFTGAVGQQRVPDDFLKSLEIPLPPLDEQRRIAGVLREQMAAVEKARAASEEELQTINALPAALLCRAFNGEL